jgi:hypothetical protein
MNAAIVLGWTDEKDQPRYYDILLTGSEILLERNGFHTPSGRPWEHLTDPQPFVVEPNRRYRFAIDVWPSELVVKVDGSELLLATSVPPRPGRVGLRPWRSTLSCTKFTVGVAAAAGRY